MNWNNSFWVALPSWWQGLCCSSEWNPYQGNQIPPHTLYRPFAHGGWCVQHAGSSSPLCRPSLPLPSHYQLSGPAWGYPKSDRNTELISTCNISSDLINKELHFWHFGINETKYVDQWLNRDLVYEVEGNSSLPCAHLSRFEVAAVLVTDVVHAGLQFSSNLIFLPVLLPLHSVNKGKKAEDQRVKTVRRKSRDMEHSNFLPAWGFFWGPNEILLKDNFFSIKCDFESICKGHRMSPASLQTEMPTKTHFLYLELWVGIKHDVFNGALNVLSPAGQPCYSVVVSNLLPTVTSRRHRNTSLSVN